MVVAFEEMSEIPKSRKSSLAGTIKLSLLFRLDLLSECRVWRSLYVSTKATSMRTVDRMQSFSSGACRTRGEDTGMGISWIDGRSCRIAKDVMETVPHINCSLPVLTPNLKVSSKIALAVKEFAVSASASEAFSKANIEIAALKIAFLIEHQ